MTYASLSSFAQTAGLIYFVGMFAVAVGYVLWPRNRERFERAAHLPLAED